MRRARQSPDRLLQEQERRSSSRSHVAPPAGPLHASTSRAGGRSLRRRGRSRPRAARSVTAHRRGPPSAAGVLLREDSGDECTERGTGSTDVDRRGIPGRYSAGPRFVADLPVIPTAAQGWVRARPRLLPCGPASPPGSGREVRVRGAPGARPAAVPEYGDRRPSRGHPVSPSQETLIPSVSAVTASTTWC